MRMSRLNLGIALASPGAMDFGGAMGRATGTLDDISNILHYTQPSKYKSKPNRLSQKKRRLNARRQGKHK